MPVHVPLQSQLRLLFMFPSLHLLLLLIVPFYLLRSLRMPHSVTFQDTPKMLRSGLRKGKSPRSTLPILRNRIKRFKQWVGQKVHVLSAAVIAQRTPDRNSSRKELAPLALQATRLRAQKANNLPVEMNLVSSARRANQTMCSHVPPFQMRRMHQSLLVVLIVIFLLVFTAHIDQASEQSLSCVRCQHRQIVVPSLHHFRRLREFTKNRKPNLPLPLPLLPDQLQ